VGARAGVESRRLEPTVEQAYRICDEITRTQARNFWYGIRLLPPVKRRALSAVYAFARRVDDVADGSGDADHKLTSLHRLREEFDTADAPGDAVLVALFDAARRLPIPLDAFGDLIDGCEADIRGTSYPAFDDLVGYCRLVAGSIGRLSLGVFGTSADLGVAAAQADALGVALQLTNILRDIREDLACGRIYLPAEDLAKFSIELQAGPDGSLAVPPDDLAQLVRFETARAREWYETGLRLLDGLDHRSAACCSAMAGIYIRLLDRIEADPCAVGQLRVALPTWQKAIVAARCIALGRP
jgi:phytoene synthase